MRPFSIKCRPSFAYWGPAVVFNGLVLIVLLISQSSISTMIHRALRDAGVPSGIAYQIPYWLLLGLVPAVIIFKTLIQALTTEYEISLDRVRIVLGGLKRREVFVELSEIRSLSFEQNLLEAYFRVGRILMSPYHGMPFSIPGVPNAAQVVAVLRERLKAFPPPMVHHAGAPHGEASQRHMQSQPVHQVIVQQRSSGCMTCLVILLIIIVFPVALGVIFNISLITGLIAAIAVAVRQLLG